jgi:monofunctional biosynthetic peptidoglycan transglycosylase
MKKILQNIGKWIARVFLAYAVLFSVTVTTALVVLARTLWQPVAKVKYLKDHNPEATVFMAALQEGGGLAVRRDSLLHSYVPIDFVSPHLVEAVIAAEDYDFYVHPGFDLLAILKAYEYNTERGKIIRGASTITQQLAKNLFLSNEKTFARKYKELFYTLLLEHFLGKKRIMELYINYAQWGKNIFGCEAASQFYFKKSSAKLTLNESARLAAVLVKPAKLSPLNAGGPFMQQRIVMIANNIYLKNKKAFQADEFPIVRSDSLVLPFPADTPGQNSIPYDTVSPK